MNIIYVVSFALVSVYFFYSVYKEPVSPIPYVVYFFSLYFFSTVLGNRTLIYSLSFELVWYFYFVLIVAALFLGKYFSSRVRIGLAIDIPLRAVRKGVFIYGAVFSPIWIYFFIGVLKYIIAGRGSYGESWELTRSLVIFGNPILTFGLFFVSIFFLTGKKTWLVLLFFLLGIAFVLGERGDITNIVLALFVVFFLNKKKLKLFPVALIVAIGVAGIYGNSRAQLEVGAGHFVSTILGQLVENPVLLIAPVDVNEFINVAAPSKAAMYDGFHLPDKGMNLFRGVLKILPIMGRYIEAPFGTSGEQVREAYFETLFDQGVVSGSGALLPLGFDLYLAGGFLVVFVGLFFFSFYINRLYLVAQRGGNLFASLAYVLSFPLFTIQVQRSGFESAVVYLFKQHYLPLYVCMFVYLIYLFLRMKKDA